PPSRAPSAGSRGLVLYVVVTFRSGSGNCTKGNTGSIEPSASPSRIEPAADPAAQRDGTPLFRTGGRPRLRSRRGEEQHRWRAGEWGVPLSSSMERNRV